MQGRTCKATLALTFRIPHAGLSPISYSRLRGVAPFHASPIAGRAGRGQMGSHAVGCDKAWRPCLERLSARTDLHLKSGRPRAALRTHHSGPRLTASQPVWCAEPKRLIVSLSRTKIGGHAVELGSEVRDVLRVPVSHSYAPSFASSRDCPYSESGSSPHTWGGSAKIHSQDGLIRFIPTYVGTLLSLDGSGSDRLLGGGSVSI